MRRFSVDDAEATLGGQGFSVSLAHAWYRKALILKDAIQVRVGGRPPNGADQLPDFVRAINGWLPSNANRLLWADHWNGGYYGSDQRLLEAACLGLGDARSLEDAPGYFFEAMDWEPDPLEIARHQADELGLLVGLTATLMTTGSDGWLIAGGSQDRIEFWEGNIFFHSSDAELIRGAQAIFQTFGCSRELL